MSLVIAANHLALTGLDTASFPRLLLRSARVVPQVVEPKQGPAVRGTLAAGGAADGGAAAAWVA
jgi:hypothetical protein